MNFRINMTVTFDIFISTGVPVYLDISRFGPPAGPYPPVDLDPRGFKGFPRPQGLSSSEERRGKSLGTRLVDLDPQPGFPLITHAKLYLWGDGVEHK